MKRFIFRIFTVMTLLSVVAATSCSKDDEGTTVTEKSSQSFSINDLKDGNVTPSTDVDIWKISGEVENGDIPTLRSAIGTLGDAGKTIELIFTETTTLPNEILCFNTKDNEKCRSVITSVTLTVATSIGWYALNYNTALVSVSLQNVETIKDSAFYGCTDLVSVSLPSVKTIGDYAFMGCSSLTTLEISTATEIGENVITNAKITDLDISGVENQDNMEKAFASFSNSGSCDLVVNSALINEASFGGKDKDAWKSVTAKSTSDE